QSPSHQIVLDPTGDRDVVITGPRVIKLAAHDVIPNKDFVLRYEVAGAKPEMALLANHAASGGYFMLMFQPPESAQPAEITPKEMVFVMDCSGSMSGEPISLSKKAVRYALNNLNPQDTFQIIRFSESASPFSKEPLLATQENIRRGLSYINGLEGEGGTMMIEGIKSALDYPHRENRLRIVCFMTDGYIGNEAEILAAIEKKIGDNTRLFSFGVGSSVNRYLLERMAEVGRGEVQYVLLNEKPDQAVEKFYERVRNPVLTSIRIDWAGLEVQDLTPARIKDLFMGQPISLMGRYSKAGQGTIRILAKQAGQEVAYPLAINLPSIEDANQALPALWARSRIRELESEQYGGDNQDVVKAITDLALQYRLMSAYTAFVAVEEKVVNESGQVKTIQVPVEMPDGVSYEGVFGRQDAAVPMVGALAAPSSTARQAPAKTKSFFSFAERKRNEAVADRMESEEPAAPSMEIFSLTLKLDDASGQRVIQITESGEVWDSLFDASGATLHHILLRRLHQDEVRELWRMISLSLDKPTKTVNWTAKGQLNIQVKEKSGTKDVQVGLKSSDKPDTNEWSSLIEFLLAKSK
ncbi:MAG: VWA domain-containing protein, partial [Lentisphaerota bacterium]